MKKLLLTIVAIAAIALPGCAQSASSLIKEFKNEKGAEYEKVSYITMSIAKLSGDKKSRKIDSVQMLELEDCSDEVRRSFGEKLKKLNHKCKLGRDEIGDVISFTMSGK